MSTRRPGTIDVPRRDTSHAGTHKFVSELFSCLALFFTSDTSDRAKKVETNQQSECLPNFIAYPDEPRADGRAGSHVKTGNCHNIARPCRCDTNTWGDQGCLNLKDSPPDRETSTRDHPTPGSG